MVQFTDKMRLPAVIAQIEESIAQVEMCHTRLLLVKEQLQARGLDTRETEMSLRKCEQVAADFRSRRRSLLRQDRNRSAQLRNPGRA